MDPQEGFPCLYLVKRAREVFRSAKALWRINRGSVVLMAGAATITALKGQGFIKLPQADRIT